MVLPRVLLSDSDGWYESNLAANLGHSANIAGLRPESASSGPNLVRHQARRLWRTSSARQCVIEIGRPGGGGQGFSKANCSRFAEPKLTRPLRCASHPWNMFAWPALLDISAFLRGGVCRMSELEMRRAASAPSSKRTRTLPTAAPVPLRRAKRSVPSAPRATASQSRGRANRAAGRPTRTWWLCGPKWPWQLDHSGAPRCRLHNPSHASLMGNLAGRLRGGGRPRGRPRRARSWTTVGAIGIT